MRGPRKRDLNRSSAQNWSRKNNLSLSLSPWMRESERVDNISQLGMSARTVHDLKIDVITRESVPPARIKS